MYFPLIEVSGEIRPLQFKTFQLLRFFPDLTDVPDQVVDFIRGELGQRSTVRLAEYKWVQQYRHMNAVRTRLRVIAFYGSDAIDVAERHAKAMSFLLDQRADIINSVIEELTRQNYELPAYSTLNDLAERVHAQSLEAIFNQVVNRTPIEVIHQLKELLVTDFGRRQSDFNALKQAPRKPSRKHLEVLIDHLSWLEEFGDVDAVFEGVTEPKIRHFPR